MSLPAPSDRDARENPADSFVGRVIEQRYRVEERLGEGGLGTVYRAQHLKLARPVAVKVLRDDLRGIPQLRARFEREVKALSSLSHPNVVTITDYGVEGGMPFLVMELVEGTELAKMVGAPLPPRRALAIARQILASLAYAHERDVVHRDLKPANVIVRALPDGRDHVTVLDFGLAKFVGDDAGGDLTRSGLVVGTPAYMPPEQMAAGARRADARSDLYAAGLILFELLTGRRPFAFEEPADLLRAHLVMEPPSLSEALGGAPVSADLEALVARALAKAPDARFPHARAMIDAIDALPMEGLVGGRAGTVVREDATRPARPTPISAAAASRRSTATAAERARSMGGRAAIAALVFLATLAGIAWATQRSAPEDATAEADAPGTAARESPAGVVAVAGGAVETEAEAEADSEADAEADSELEAEAEAGSGNESAEEAEALAAAEGEDDEAFVAPASTGPRPAARNPLRARLRGVLGRVQAKLARGRDLTARELRTLQRYRNEHPQDVRARLLLGHAYMARGWISHALDQYERAVAADASVRGDPGVLDGLLRAARTESLHSRAADMIARIYGDEARAALARAIARASGAERARLETVSARLPAG